MITLTIEVSKTIEVSQPAQYPCQDSLCGFHPSICYIAQDHGDEHEHEVHQAQHTTYCVEDGGG